MKEITFEKALEKLEEIVAQLEAGDLSLDASMKKYEEGIKLARFCQEKLEKAKAKVETLVKEGEGRFSKKAFEEMKTKEGEEEA